MSPDGVQYPEPNAHGLIRVDPFSKPVARPRKSLSSGDVVVDQKVGASELKRAGVAEGEQSAKKLKLDVEL